MKKWLLVCLALLAAWPAFAADGDFLQAVSWTAGQRWAGSGRKTDGYLLCDENHASANACAEIDMSGSKAPPDTIQFGIYRQSTNCTPTVNVYGRFAPTATGGATQVDHLVVTLLGTGTSSYSPAVPAQFRIYYATVSADADCTDLEVVLLLNYVH